MDPLDAGAGAAATAFLGTIGLWIKARLQRDSSFAGPLLQRLEEQDERIDGLRDRLDEKDAQLGQLARETAECHRSRDECRRETAELRTHVSELQAVISRRDEDVTRRVKLAVQQEVRRTPTPPGAWRAEGDE